MAMIYRTKSDDEIDFICFKHYGFTEGAVEALLKANRAVRDGRSLAEFSPVLEAGLTIALPPLKRPVETTRIVRLND